MAKKHTSVPEVYYAWDNPKETEWQKGLNQKKKRSGELILIRPYGIDSGMSPELRDKCEQNGLTVKDIVLKDGVDAGWENLSVEAFNRIKDSIQDKNLIFVGSEAMKLLDANSEYLLKKTKCKKLTDFSTPKSQAQKKDSSTKQSGGNNFANSSFENMVLDMENLSGSIDRGITGDRKEPKGSFKKDSEKDDKEDSSKKDPEKDDKDKFVWKPKSRRAANEKPEKKQVTRTKSPTTISGQRGPSRPEKRPTKEPDPENFSSDEMSNQAGTVQLSSKIQNARNAYFSALRERLNTHIQRKVQMSGAPWKPNGNDLLRATRYLSASNNIEEFSNSWKSYAPEKRLELDGEAYEELRKEAIFVVVAADVLYEQDTFPDA